MPSPLVGPLLFCAGLYLGWRLADVRLVLYDPLWPGRAVRAFRRWRWGVLYRA